MSLEAIRPNNDNCLEGMHCPSCGQSTEFNVMARQLMTLSDDGCENEFSGDIDWDDDSFASCNECSWHGTMADLKDEQGGVVKFEVLTNMVGGYENCWTDGEGEAVTYADREDAEQAIRDYIIDRIEAVERGDVLDSPDRSEFRIKKITAAPKPLGTVLPQANESKHLLSNAIAISAALHGDEAFGKFYEQVGKSIGGFTGIYDVCEEAARSISAYEAKHGGANECWQEMPDGLDWAETVDYLVQRILNHGIEHFEVPVTDEALESVLTQRRTVKAAKDASCAS